MYAAEADRGGRFLRLGDGKLDNKAEKYYWFCRQCDNETLGGWERYASQLCRAIDKAPAEPVEYDEKLLKFAVSISWRTAKAHSERTGSKSSEQLRKACRHWKLYLQDKKARVEPYSQHIYLLYGHPLGRPESLGGSVCANDGFIYSQIGYLRIFGLLGRGSLSMDDIRIWEESKLLREGGVITPVKEVTMGRTVTRKCGRMLRRFERFVYRRAHEMGPILADRLS
jgi:hypothetical protein